MSQMIEVKTAELIGSALDWAVAKATSTDQLDFVPWGDGEAVNCFCWLPDGGRRTNRCSPSTDWAQGGPLIEKFNIGLLQPSASMCGEWHASTLHPDFTDYTHKTSPLIAACRAIVAANLGDVVSVPAELVGGGV